MISAAQVFRNLNAQAIEAQQKAYSATDTQKTGESGKAMGYAVKMMSDPGESLMDSMEELSMSFEEKKLNDIGKRKLGEMRGKSTLLATMIDKWMKTLPDMPDQAHMEKLLRRIRSLLQQGGTPEDLLSLLERDSDDAVEQFAMLDVLENAGGLDDESKKLIQAAKSLLQRTKGEEIRAGINLAQIVNARSADISELKELRKLYRNEVLGYRNPQDCYRALLAQRGAEGIKLSLDFLVEACGVDIQSASPSKSKTELGRILGDLQCVNTLTAALDRTNVLVAKMARQFGEKTALDGTALMGKLIDLTEKSFVDKREIVSLEKSVGLGSTLGRLYFMTSLQGIVRQLSTRLFEDESTRTRLVDAVQEHLDDLVAEQQKVDERE